MKTEQINAIIERKRLVHPELSEALTWKNFLIICDRENVPTYRIPLPRNAMIVNFDGEWGVGINSAKLSSRHDTADGAHELAHLWLHVPDMAPGDTLCMHHAYGDSPDPREDEADYAAAALLYGPQYFPTLAPIAILESMQKGSDLVKVDQSDVTVAGDGSFATLVLETQTLFHQAALASFVADLPPGTEKQIGATLTPENGNLEDAKAVRVDVGSRSVGYLSRENARAFRRRYSRRTVHCVGLIVGGWGRGRRSESLGIKLDIKL